MALHLGNVQIDDAHFDCDLRQVKPDCSITCVHVIAAESMT